MSLDCFRFAAVQKFDEQPASLPGRIEIEVLQPHSNCQKICGVSDSLTPRLLRWRLENRVCTLCLNLHRSVLCLSNSFSHHCCVATPSYGLQADAFDDFYKEEIHAEPDADVVSAIWNSRLFKCQKLNG